MARFMNDNVPGVHVDETLIRRIAGAADPAQEGALICAEQIRELRKLCSGIHLMPVGNNAVVPEILQMARGRI
jgi:5,10-methylenetetrahydrofolate reductase